MSKDNSKEIEKRKSTRINWKDPVVQFSRGLRQDSVMTRLRTRQIESNPTASQQGEVIKVAQNDFVKVSRTLNETFTVNMSSLSNFEASFLSSPARFTSLQEVLAEANECIGASNSSMESTIDSISEALPELGHIPKEEDAVHVAGAQSSVIIEEVEKDNSEEKSGQAVEDESKISEPEKVVEVCSTSQSVKKPKLKVVKRKIMKKKFVEPKHAYTPGGRLICKPTPQQSAVLEAMKKSKDNSEPQEKVANLSSVNLYDIPTKTFLVEQVMEIPADTIKYAVFLNSNKKKSFFKLVRKVTENGIDELTFRSVTYEKLEDNAKKNLSQVLQIAPPHAVGTVTSKEENPKLAKGYDDLTQYFSQDHMQSTIIACPFSSMFNKTHAETLLELENLPDDGNASVPINNIDKLMTVVRSRERYAQETYEMNQNLAQEVQELQNTLADLRENYDTLRNQTGVLNDEEPVNQNVTEDNGESPEVIGHFAGNPPPAANQATGTGEQRRRASTPTGRAPANPVTAPVPTTIRTPLEKRKLGERYEAEKPFLPWFQTFNYNCQVDDITGSEKTRWFVKHLGAEAGVKVLSQLETKYPNGFHNRNFEELVPTILHVLGDFVGNEEVQAAQAMKLRQGLTERVDEYIHKKRTALKTSCPRLDQESVKMLILSGLNDRFLQVYSAIGKTGDILQDLMSTQEQIDATEAIIKGTNDHRAKSWYYKFDLRPPKPRNQNNGNTGTKPGDTKKPAEQGTSKENPNQKEGHPGPSRNDRRNDFRTPGNDQRGRGRQGNFVSFRSENRGFNRNNPNPDSGFNFGNPNDSRGPPNSSGRGRENPGFGFRPPRDQRQNDRPFYDDRRNNDRGYGNPNYGNQNYGNQNYGDRSFDRPFNNRNRNPNNDQDRGDRQGRPPTGQQHPRRNQNDSHAMPSEHEPDCSGFSANTTVKPIRSEANRLYYVNTIEVLGQNTQSRPPPSYEEFYEVDSDNSSEVTVIERENMEEGELSESDREGGDEESDQENQEGMDC